MEAILSSETSVPTRDTRRHIPADGILHSHRRGKPQIIQIFISRKKAKTRACINTLAGWCVIIISEAVRSVSSELFWHILESRAHSLNRVSTTFRDSKHNGPQRLHWSLHRHSSLSPQLISRLQLIHKDRRVEGRHMTGDYRWRWNAEEMKQVSKLSFYKDLKNLTRSEQQDILRYSFRIHQITSPGRYRYDSEWQTHHPPTSTALYYRVYNQCHTTVFRISMPRKEGTKILQFPSREILRSDRCREDNEVDNKHNSRKGKRNFSLL
jgi:hypothetical protein